MQSKMLAYDVAVQELNKARLRGTSSPVVHTLLNISQNITNDVSLVSVLDVDTSNGI